MRTVAKLKNMTFDPETTRAEATAEQNSDAAAMKMRKAN
jgi:hypothetical protein